MKARYTCKISLSLSLSLSQTDRRAQKTASNLTTPNQITGKLISDTWKGSGPHLINLKNVHDNQEGWDGIMRGLICM
jgi:hypothetical protein